MIIRITSFSVDVTSKQSCSSPALGKGKPVKPPSSVWEDFIKVEGWDLKYPRTACKHCGTSYACDSKRNGRGIENCLEGWGIDRLFTVIVDNASSNDVAIAYLVKKFKDGAIKCQKTFERLEEHDPSYLPKDDIPTAEDWDNAKVFVKFLKIFSEMTLSMQTKFNKYWGITTSEKTNLLLYVSVVLDPSGSYKARAVVHDRFKQNNKTCLDDAKTEVARYLDEARIEDEYLDLLNWWKVNSSQFKIICQVARDIYSIPISTVPSESVFSTGGQNWIRSKPLDDMTEEIDGVEEIDEEFMNIGKEMEAAFENLNNDAMV
ncbi:zinc finger BED domain-containing protein RICESLEEPER 2-like [Cucumis melo var. makuwa]|uniref:Zinc finger BED domain-containing protein RICESLEEPER 2-like n=1 Tax=Cucumis melo var. makuwa TaxID=1194695 RepID=A0A5A7THQ6_CUCMM|nr:zinc finger BED domain-containing protein RICESLEEPER 2-like [Cucumis melo var. makuwa]TYK05277.1 zinc finger BED domain-containing protein RICESLEEPER 2-like [Cucumis melo var. makuwa]